MGPPKSKKPKSYTEDDISKALADIDAGMNISAAATKNSIPRQTLHNRYANLSSAKQGRPTALSPDEVISINWNNYFIKFNFNQNILILT
jgi:hypothetical protein